MQRMCHRNIEQSRAWLSKRRHRPCLMIFFPLLLLFFLFTSAVCIHGEMAKCITLLHCQHYTHREIEKVKERERTHIQSDKHLTMASSHTTCNIHQYCTYRHICQRYMFRSEIQDEGIGNLFFLGTEKR